MKGDREIEERERERERKRERIRERDSQRGEEFTLIMNW